VDTPENRQALIDKQKDLDAKIDMILDKFLEESRKVNLDGLDLKKLKKEVDETKKKDDMNLERLKKVSE
jgi:hypothetical protein